MKKTAWYIVILILVAATVGGSTVGIILMNQNNIASANTLLLDESGKVILEVALEDIYPGDESVYTVHLETTGGGDYLINFEFKSSGEVSLAPFIDIELRCGDEVLAGFKLQDHLDSEKVVLPITLDSGTLDLDIAYIMDIEVGNEAQNKACDFVFTVSAD